MIFADSRTWRERLTPFDHDRIFLIVNSTRYDASRGEFSLLSLFRYEYALGVRFFVLRLPRFFI